MHTDELVDGDEEEGEGSSQPILQSALGQGFRLGCIGDFLKSRPQNSLHDHLPKLILKQLPISHENLKQTLNGLSLNIKPEISADAVNCAEQG